RSSSRVRAAWRKRSIATNPPLPPSTARKSTPRRKPRLPRRKDRYSRSCTRIPKGGATETAPVGAATSTSAATGSGKRDADRPGGGPARRGGQSGGHERRARG